jgi:membrane-associated phospholipid phosphatase
MQHWSYNFKSKQYIAKIISTFTNAPLVAILVFLLINYYLLKGYEFVVVTFISIIFAALIPSIIAFLWIKNEKIEIDMPRKEDRFYPLLWIILSYLIGVVLLYILSAPPITTVLMFCYFSNTLIVLLISLFWKISIHSIGVAGPAAALIYVFGYTGLIFIILIPLVIWSRLYLKRHTFYQVIVGASLGFTLTALQIYLLIGFK